MADDNAKGEEKIEVGQRVVVMGKRKGKVRFVGPTAYGPGEWVGVELDKPSGSHDGGAHGHRYFTCSPNHGVYVQRQGIQRIQSWGVAASHIQSLLRGRKDRQDVDYKRAFHTWTQMEQQDDNDHLSQAAQISRVEQMLRAYHPGSAGTPQGNSAVALSVAAGVSVKPAEWGEDLTVEDSYTGPHLTWPVTLEQVEAVLHHIRSRPHEPLHQKYVMQLVGRSVKLFSESLSVHDMQVPPCDDGKLIILGDTHGQLADFLWVLQQNGVPSESTAYLLNGDIADRGQHACEIFIIVLLYKQIYPDLVSINRGNHENIEMNRRSFENGGGFFSEVKGKYDASLFMMFSQLFEALPIATVVSGKVFVVHGGLYRREGVQIQHLRTINRRRQCPSNTDNIEDALLFDCMWSDPWDFPGVTKAAHRGTNCIRFGPDVTKRFLGNNALSLCIRSHEVPSSLHGFEDRHDGRLITVFTASNYCGQTGNFGAVVIFHCDMSYTIEEHVAPPLESLVSEYNGISSKDASAMQLVCAAFQNKNRPEHEVRKEQATYLEKMEEENLVKIEALVLKHKDELWWYWTHVDADNTCKVSSALWRQGMSSCLQLDLPWFSLQRSLADVDKDGNVNYKTFLDGIRPQIDQDKAFESGWEYQVVRKAYEAMLNCDLALANIIQLFDSDGDGLVSPQEFKQALQAANIGLPETQINAILRVIERDEKGKLDVKTFLDRFQVVYSAGNQGAKATDNNKEKLELMNTVGNKLLRGGSKIRMDIFKSIDTNNDGYLDKEEFYAALENLQMNMSEEQKFIVWSAVDLNADGHLNYLEFCAAFQVVDTSNFSSTAVREIMEAVLSSLQQNQDSLNFSFRYFDPENKGKVKTSDFMAGLRALNASLGGGRAPFSDDQLEVLVAFVDKDKDGFIEYDEFLSAFNPKSTSSELSDIRKAGRISRTGSRGTGTDTDSPRISRVGSRAAATDTDSRGRPSVARSSSTGGEANR